MILYRLPRCRGIHTYIHTYIHEYTHTHIYTYMHIYIYIYIYMHTYTPSHQKFWITISFQFMSLCIRESSQTSVHKKLPCSFGKFLATNSSTKRHVTFRKFLQQTAARNAMLLLGSSCNKQQHETPRYFWEVSCSKQQHETATFVGCGSVLLLTITAVPYWSYHASFRSLFWASLVKRFLRTFLTLLFAAKDALRNYRSACGR
jgi:hypothetical protein